MPTFKTPNPNDDGSQSYRLITGRSYSLAPLPPGVSADSIPAICIRLANDQLSILADVTTSANTDPTLSAIGRARALQPAQVTTIEKCSQWSAQLSNFESAVAKRDANMVAVPVLATGATADALVDIEARAWLRSLSPSERAKATTAAAADASYARLMLALLRSPIPLPGSEQEMFVDAWNRTQRAAHPDIAASIDSDLAAIEWARNQLALLVSMVVSLVAPWGFDTARIMQCLDDSQNELAKSGFAIFGITESAAANARLRLKAQGTAAQYQA